MSDLLSHSVAFIPALLDAVVASVTGAAVKTAPILLRTRSYSDVTLASKRARSILVSVCDAFGENSTSRGVCQTLCRAVYLYSSSLYLLSQNQPSLLSVCMFLKEATGLLSSVCCCHRNYLNLLHCFSWLPILDWKVSLRGERGRFSSVSDVWPLRVLLRLFCFRQYRLFSQIQLFITRQGPYYHFTVKIHLSRCSLM